MSTVDTTTASGQTSRAIRSSEIIDSKRLAPYDIYIQHEGAGAGAYTFNIQARLGYDNEYSWTTINSTPYNQTDSNKVAKINAGIGAEFRVQVPAGAATSVKVRFMF